jgi:hypothetical protein
MATEVGAVKLIQCSLCPRALRAVVVGRPSSHPWMFLRFAFEWRWPVIRYVTAADHQGLLNIVLNRYPGIVIGVAVYSGHRGLSLLWGRPGKERDV